VALNVADEAADQVGVSPPVAEHLRAGEADAHIGGSTQGLGHP
jgi:hypothetical protein